jgi:hypothetical protein
LISRQKQPRPCRRGCFQRNRGRVSGSPRSAGALLPAVPRTRCGPSVVIRVRGYPDTVSLPREVFRRCSFGGMGRRESPGRVGSPAGARPSFPPKPLGGSTSLRRIHLSKASPSSCAFRRRRGIRRSAARIARHGQGAARDGPSASWRRRQGITAASGRRPTFLVHWATSLPLAEAVNATRR